MNRDRLEFFLDGAPMLNAQSSHAPQVGEMVSIKGEGFRVTRRSYAVDYSSDPATREVVCTVDMERVI